MKRFSISTLLCLALVLTLQTSFARADEPDKNGWPFQLRFLSGPPGGNWFVLGNAFSDIWTREVLNTHTTSGGGVTNIINVNGRKGDMGFSVASFMGAALRGEDDFENNVADNAVILANLYKQVTYFLIARDYAESNGIKSLGDLLKKDKVRFATLKPGTASEFAVKALFTKGYGKSPQDLKNEKQWSVAYASYEGGADMLADGAIDCFAFSVGSGASIVANIESKVSVKVLSVEKEALDALAAAYGTTEHIIPSGVYASVETPVRTLGDYTCIVIRKDLPESLVFELNKALWKNKNSLAESVADMRELQPATALPTGVPCHQGSTKFWLSAPAANE